MNLTATLLVLSVVAQSPQGEGFFYAVQPPQGSDRLFRIEWDGTLTPIGEPGAFGFPSVEAIVWDQENEKLYGHETTFNILVEIDTQTSEATEVGPLDIPGGDLRHWSFNVNDGLLYALVNGQLYAIDSASGSWNLVRDLRGSADQGLTHTLDAIRGLDGFYSVGAGGGLFLVTEPDWATISLGGTVRSSGFDQLFWDASTDTLWHVKNARPIQFYNVNQVTGDEELSIELPKLPFSPVFSLAFVSSESERPDCSSMDTDDDGDIDLDDYTVFSECFTGPGG